MPVEHISDTARWVAFYRALETERPDAIFRDPWARRLAGARGEEIVRRLPRARSNAWAMIVRTALFDEIILRLIEREGADLVLDLAAGLDTRAFRLPLPAGLRWVDVDLPAILDYKLDMLRDVEPRCAYEAVRTDLTDAAARRVLFARIGDQARRALVLTEGLLVYLTAEQVGSLATDLHAVPSFHAWLIDLAGPLVLRIMNRHWGKAVARGNAPFRFAPAEGAEFFRRFGWREARFLSTMDEARRLHREMRFAWLWRAVARLYPARRREEFRRMSAVVLLERL